MGKESYKLTMDLSIVIPVLNEKEKIKTDIEEADRFISLGKGSGEIIISDDGSSDGTSSLVELLKPNIKSPIILVRSSVHRGKGAALRDGFRRTKGSIILFTDSGYCVPYENAMRGIGLVRSGETKIAHGSRNHPDSRIYRDRGVRRKLSSIIFRILSRFLLPLPADLSDTQCGFKIYDGDTGRALYDKSFLTGFLIDLEIILLAKLENLTIKEFAIDWTPDLDSRLKSGQRVSGILRDLLTLRRRFKKKILRFLL